MDSDEENDVMILDAPGGGAGPAEPRARPGAPRRAPGKRRATSVVSGKPKRTKKAAPAEGINPAKGTATEQLQGFPDLLRQLVDSATQEATNNMEELAEELEVSKEENAELRRAAVTDKAAVTLAVNKNAVLEQQLRAIRDVHEPKLPGNCNTCFTDDLAGLTCSADIHHSCLYCALACLRDTNIVSQLVVRRQEVFMKCVGNCMLPMHGYLLLCNSAADLLDLVRGLDQAKEYNREREDIERNISQLGKSKQEKLLMQIKDQVLTLICPVCTKPFNDFDACAVLKCSLCNYKFCGWCFEYLPITGDQHGHVADCARNPDPGDVFTTFPAWKAESVVYRKSKLEKFLAGLSFELQFEIMADVKRLSDEAFA